MSKQPAVNNLADKYYITLIIRLLVDKQGELQRGVVVDLSENQIGQFLQLTTLPNLIARWLNTWVLRQSTSDLDNMP